MNRINRDLTGRLDTIARKYAREIAKDLFLADEDWSGCDSKPKTLKAHIKTDDAWIRGAFIAELFPNILRGHVVRTLSMLNMAQAIHEDAKSPMFLDTDGQWKVRQQEGPLDSV